MTHLTCWPVTTPTAKTWVLETQHMQSIRLHIKGQAEVALFGWIHF